MSRWYPRLTARERALVLGDPIPVIGSRNADPELQVALLDAAVSTCEEIAERSRRIADSAEAQARRLAEARTLTRELVMG